MVNYKDLGLVNTREMFAKAVDGGYAIPAFNFNNMEQMQAIIKACAETKSPVILQVSSGARKYANQTLLRYMAQGAVEYAKELGWEHPQIALHLALQGAVEAVLINLLVFDESVFPDQLAKTPGTQEIVFHAILLRAPRRARGGGNGDFELRMKPQQVIDDSALAGAGRCRKDDDFA